MAASHYRNYLDSIIDNYAGRLITCIAQIDDSSENFQIAERFVTSNIKYHRFLDTNKNEVQRNLQGVIEKLTIHSQSEKAERFDFLIKRFLKKPLKQDIPDIHYVVLSMLLNLSTNPLESVYIPTRFYTRVDDQEELIYDLRRELNIEDEVREEWGYSDAESVDENQEDGEMEEEEVKDNQIQKQKPDNLEKQPLKLTTLGEVVEPPRAPAIKEKPQPEADRTFPQFQQDNLNISMIDKSLVLGTLPMQPYSAFTGLGVFRLPLGEVQKQSNIPSNIPSSIPQQPSLSLNLKPLPTKEQPSFLFPTQQIQPPPRIPAQRFEQQQAQRSAKKRKFNQLDEAPEKPSEALNEVKRYEEDKKFIEKTFLQTDLWKNPNSLNTILQEYYMKPDSKGRQRSEYSGINHWFFTMTTERALIQDVLLMLNGIENESFKINEFHHFERRNPLQLKHASPEALKNTIDKLILLANTTVEVGTSLKLLSDNFNTTVMEGFTECVRDFGREYKSYIEDVQCIFMKQASQVKPKDLGVRHPALQDYIEKRSITLMELLSIFGSYIKNFRLICEICRHLIETFNNAASDIEQVVRGDTTLANFAEIKPFISMIVLSYLHRIFTEAIFGANDDSANGLIIRLFFKSWEPYLDILDKWLKHGTLMDKYSEFFIKYDKNSNIIANFYAKLNWDEDFTFQTYTVKWKLLSEERTFICVPNFLAKYADTVSRIGKTIKVLGYLIHQENLYLYLDKFDFKEQFFSTLLSRMREDEAYIDTFMNEEIVTPALSKPSDSSEKVKIKDYTFGAKLRSQPKNKEKHDAEKDQNILYNSLPNKLDAYMNNFELSKFSIKAFSINTPLASTQDTNKLKQNGLIQKDKEKKQDLDTTQDVVTKVSSAVHFYEKVQKTKNQENLNNLKIHLDYEIEHLLISMDSDFSAQLTDLLFDHFHLMEHLRILRMVFFLQKEPIYENFLQEVLLKIRSTLLENNLVKLNQLLKDALGKISSHQVRNISSLFSIENESKEEPAYNFSIMNNYTVTFKPTYPLDIIFDNEIMRLYNRIFKFILQIKRAKFALTSNNVSIKKPLKVHGGKPKKSASRDITIDEMEEEDASPWNKRPMLETTAKVNEINSLKRSFGLAQTELLHFVNNLEFFVGYSVIEEHTKEYEKHIKESTKITEIRQTVKEYLEKIAEICQLHNKKNDMLFELLKSTLNLCWDFYNLYNRFEERFTYMSNTDGSMTKIRSELELIMRNFRDNNKMVLQILHQYHQKGHKLYIKSLFSNLNYNYFYLSETGDYIQ